MTDRIRPLRQTPAPGARHLRFRGDTCTFSLTLSAPAPGAAWLRTNLGHGRISREEIIREVDRDESPLGRDWFDIPMKRYSERGFEVTLPLAEVGHFEAKAYFLPEDEIQPVWPDGPNTVINVEPADTCCANILYNAFVRQFGPNISGNAEPPPVLAECIRALDKTGYTVIPQSGTFRDLIHKLDFIIGELGCRYIQLLPIHPTPTTYARMGRFGSPYAALGFTAVDPALAAFDPKATPMEQFLELVDAVHARDAAIFLDIAINHTGWAATLHESHPQWLARDEEGRIEMPGAWGVTWADLTKLDYTHRDLWQYMAEVFLTWCGRGVDGFRCDAGYMIPLPAWRYIIARVREHYPDTVFFLEGLGGKISVTRNLLNVANLDWAYSELFQNYDRGQIEHYLPESISIAGTDGLMIHFCETHDNNRLAATSAAWARLRTALCALFSQHGGFAFANGVEWLAFEKIVVHESSSLNWGAAENLVDHLRRLHAILKCHPAFYDRTELRMVQREGGNCIALLRHHAPSDKKLLVTANLDPERPVALHWPKEEFPAGSPVDLVTGEAIHITERGGLHRCELAPGQVRCLTPEPADAEIIDDALHLPERLTRQRLRAKVLEIFTAYNGVGDFGDFDPVAAAQHLAENPVEFCRAMNPDGDESRVTTWQWPTDTRREVMVPPGHLLLVKADCPFRVRVVNVGAGENVIGVERSLPGASGDHFALFPLSPAPDGHQDEHRPANLKLSVYMSREPDGVRHETAPLLLLARPDAARVQKRFERAELLRTPLLFLDTNGRGGMLRANIDWARLESRYDALLAGNLNPNVPEDRWIMFTRCRAWVVFQGYSQEVRTDCLDRFEVDAEGRGVWNYHIPTGQGGDIFLTVTMRMIDGKNAMTVDFHRRAAQAGSRQLPDDRPVKLILRPDIEDRSFHETTKAFAGPENHWVESVRPGERDFLFRPAPDRRLRLALSSGGFVWEPEWYYMVHRPLEAERGLDAASDLFSPGYFSALLTGEETVTLTANILESDDDAPDLSAPVRTGSAKGSIKGMTAGTENNKDVAALDFEAALAEAMDHFVVKRDDLSTVIAGYPWFLDWGRDTLIFVRGMIAAGRIEAARAILKQFARFEKDGTLPNMIRGDDAGDRDTSDAPLWLYIGCADLIDLGAGAEGADDFLDEKCDGKRTVRDVLISLATSIIKGTPNGIRMDADSGLIFSPPHFTWMDTNFPAGTPRQGYPVEIQAFWHFALSFLSRIDAGNSAWSKTAERVRRSVESLFYLEAEGYLADCLLAEPKTKAADAVADDALRPNQLFALTLGAVTDKTICRNVLDACESLLVPGGIRSLADRPVRVPLEVRRDGVLLNDPHQPYQGRYEGDEDTRRKPAYHNGTVWSWVFPSYPEAYALHYGESGRETARAWLASASRIINAGCVGQVPEVLDGDHPHKARGCDAQAWGASELLRVWKRLRH